LIETGSDVRRKGAWRSGEESDKHAIISSTL
jgi:hypothetical protein